MGEASTRQKKPNRRRVIAIAASALLHVIVFTGLVMSSGAIVKQTTKGNGQADVEGLQLDLAGLHHTDTSTQRQARTQPPAPQQQALRALEQMASQPTTATSNNDSPSRPPARSLAQVFGANPFQPSTATDADTAAKTQKASHVESNQSNNATMNDLWKAIEPCWRRTADKSTESVTLQISFSPLGNLAKPPTILRAAGTHIDDRLLRSENQAISALAQCGPYLMAYGQQDVKVVFPSGG